MFKLKKILLFLLVFLFLVPVFGFLLFHYTSSPDGRLACLRLQNGDLILRRGRSIESFAIFLADKNRDFSHIGIVVIENKEPYVIHVAPGKSVENSNRVRKERLETFLSPDKASRFAVYRSLFPAEELDNVATKAMEFYQNRVEFDNDYDLVSDQKLYCTELVLKAYEHLPLNKQKFELQEVRILSGVYKILFPGTFVNSPQFSLLYAR